MKFRATKKEMRNGYHRILSIGYCNAQHLLNYETPIAYSAGTNGWACDYYYVDGVLISTGYAPLSSANTAASYDLIREYDRKAEAISNTYAPYAERCDKVRELLKEFISKV